MIDLLATAVADPTLLALGLAVMVGAMVQSTIGFGIAVVAAPFVVTLRPDLMPASLIVCVFFLPLLQLASGPRDVAWEHLGWAVGARVLATPLGVLLVALASADVIAMTVGILILVTVAASIWAVDIRLDRRNSAIAGAISGVSGTAASIGGPFFALVLQHERPERLRATLATFFLAGSVLGLSGLALGGQVDAEDVVAGLLWVPFVLVGHLLAGPVRRRIRPQTVRRGVLTFCVVASVGVIARALF